MKDLSYLKKSIYSWLAFFMTVLILSISYATLNGGLSVGDKVGMGSGLTAASWNRIIDGVLDLDTRVTSLSTGGSGLGVGQTWQDMTASRANDVVYTNTTGKPIFVSVSTVNANTVSAQWWYVDNVPVSMVGSMASRRSAVTLIVPNWSTYHVGWNGSNSLVYWSELR